MNYVEQMVAEIGSKVALHHCNKNMAALIVERIIADTKRACCRAVGDAYATYTTRTSPYLVDYKQAIDQAEVKGE